jgi:tetratricopeptide (TPR) repeat protein
MNINLPDFDQLWDYSRPAATESRFREALALVEGAAQESYRLQLLTQIARAQGLQRKFDEAHATLDQVQPHIDVDRLVEARYLLERGRVFNSSGAPDRSREEFLRAWEVAMAAGIDFYAVDAAHMLGIVEPLDRQLAWSLAALRLAEQSADARAQGWRGALYNNIGWSYHDQGDYPQALAIFEQALQWREAQGQSREIRIARWCVARALRSLGRMEEALQQQLALAQEHAAAAEPSGSVFEEIGECLLALGRRQEARSSFALAHAELAQDPWLQANEPERLGRLQELASI